MFVGRAKYVSRLLRKTGTDSVLVTSGGSEFQMWGAATLKARDGTSNLFCGMTRSFLSPNARVSSSLNIFCQ